MTFRYALKRSIPVMAGYIVLGIGFGMLLGAKGYGITWALAMSVFIYAGSMQYVAIDLITGGASLISAALMTLMVNARHLFYGISMVERYKDTKPYKPYLIFALTDETYSLVCSGDVPEGVEEKKYFFLVSLLNQIYWVGGATAGALLGTMMTRFLPFLIFPEGKEPPEFIQYLGKVLPYAVIGLLVIYCLKDVPGSGTYGIPEFLAIAFIVLLHRWKKSILLSIGGGTVFYMLLVQFVFCK